MPSGPRLLLENVCYHIVSRGNQKIKVFIEDEDFEYYLMKLRKYKRRYDFSLYGYCSVWSLCVCPSLFMQFPIAAKSQ